MKNTSLFSQRIMNIGKMIGKVLYDLSKYNILTSSVGMIMSNVSHKTKMKESPSCLGFHVIRMGTSEIFLNHLTSIPQILVLNDYQKKN